MMKSFPGLLAAAGATLGLLGAVQAQGQSYPTKPIKIVTPFPAGQGPDVLLRILADKMGKTLGQPVIVDTTGPAPAASLPSMP